MRGDCRQHAAKTCQGAAGVLVERSSREECRGRCRVEVVALGLRLAGGQGHRLSGWGPWPHMGIRWGVGGGAEGVRSWQKGLPTQPPMLQPCNSLGALLDLLHPLAGGVGAQVCRQEEFDLHTWAHWLEDWGWRLKVRLCHSFYYCFFYGSLK